MSSKHLANPLFLPAGRPFPFASGAAAIGV